MDDPEQALERVVISELSDGLQRELQGILELVDPHHVEAFTNAHAVLVSHATYYRRVTLKFHFDDAYPSTKAVVQLESEALPPKLVVKLKALCDEEVDKLAPEPHILAVFRRVDEIVQKNLLLFATPEIRQIKLAATQGAYKAIVNEQTGTIKLRVANAKYNLKATVTVPENYPAEQLTVEFEGTSFPGMISKMFVNQALELARRCSIGTPPEKALEFSNPIKMPDSKSGAKNGERQIALTNDYVQGLKSDVAFLKKATDLRNVNKGYNKQLHKHDHDTETRRRARRELKKLSAAEAAAERLLDEQLKKTEEMELEKQRVQARGDTAPKRCLKFLVVDFLVNEFVFGLPKKKCVISGAQLFPDNPKALEELLLSKKKRRPARGSCGCWFQFAELKTLITNPPFGIHCPNPSCNGKRVYHPAFNTDLKKLEKEWATRKAREREIAEVTDFFDLGDQFKREEETVYNSDDSDGM